MEFEGEIYTPDMVLGPARRGLKLTYTTDTRPTKSIVENAAGSDLFICEGMYGEPDKEKKAVEYKHMTFKEAGRLAKEAEVKELWLTHYSPSLTRPEEFMDSVRNISPTPGREKTENPWTLLLRRLKRGRKKGYRDSRNREFL